MKSGTNCIVVGNVVEDIPDNHIIINHAALNLDERPALIGPNGQAPFVLMYRKGQELEAIKTICGNC